MYTCITYTCYALDDIAENLPLLAATPTGIIIAASVVVLIIFGSICITIYLCKKRDKKNKEYKCQDKELNQKGE